jgi:hypothetical protein
VLTNTHCDLTIGILIPLSLSSNSGDRLTGVRTQFSAKNEKSKGKHDDPLRCAANLMLAFLK